MGATLGLGLAYAGSAREEARHISPISPLYLPYISPLSPKGSAREEARPPPRPPSQPAPISRLLSPKISPTSRQVLELLMPLVADIETPLEVVAMAALSLGLAYVGTCNEDIAQALLSVLMERDQQVLQKETNPNPNPNPTPTLTLTLTLTLTVTLPLTLTLSLTVTRCCRRRRSRG